MTAPVDIKTKLFTMGNSFRTRAGGLELKVDFLIEMKTTVVVKLQLNVAAQSTFSFENKC